MGITFEKGLNVAGYRATIFKNALAGYYRTQTPGNMIDLKTVFTNRRDGAIVFEECLDRGLISDDEEQKITENGKTIIRAKAQPRSPLAKARRILDELIDNISAMNADPDQVIYIEQVWLYGSLMRNADEVGDIDAAFVTRRRPQWDNKWDKMRKHVRRVAKRRSISLPDSGIGYYTIDDIIADRAIFGSKRHPLLAGVQKGTHDLIALGVPCQLIYDRIRGGRVNDDISSRHPDSPGRENDQPPPAEMPDLTPVSILRPMDGRWISSYHKWGNVSPHDIFRGWTDAARNLFPQYPKHLRVFASGDQPFNWSWLPKAMKRLECNGRNQILIGNKDGAISVSVCLHRQIEQNADTWSLHIHFQDIETSRKRKRLDFLSVYEMYSAALLIIAADAERMLRRAKETSPRPAIQIVIHKSDDKLLDENFVNEVFCRLDTRMVQIEPENWDATCQILLA